jgi:hypothetical protein
VPHDGRAAGVRAREAGQDVDEGRLAGTVRPQQPEELAGADFQIDAAQGVQLPEVFVQFPSAASISPSSLTSARLRRLAGRPANSTRAPRSRPRRSHSTSSASAALSTSVTPDRSKHKR